MKRVIHVIRPWEAPSSTNFLMEDGSVYEMFIGEDDEGWANAHFKLIAERYEEGNDN